MGGSASVHAGIPPNPLGKETPLARQTSPHAVHAGRYGQQAGGMHPTGMQSCLHIRRYPISSNSRNLNIIPGDPESVSSDNG